VITAVVDGTGMVGRGMIQNCVELAQHWNVLNHLIMILGWLRLFVSQQVRAFISSRDRDRDEL
jgi:hypothetical protein